MHPIGIAIDANISISFISNARLEALISTDCIPVSLENESFRLKLITLPVPVSVSAVTPEVDVVELLLLELLLEPLLEDVVFAVLDPVLWLVGLFGIVGNRKLANTAARMHRSARKRVI